MSTLILKADFPYNDKIPQNLPANVFTVTKCYEETFNFGLVLGRSLKPGNVVALHGGLGAGKTCLCAGICRALGVKEPVTSPTYTIIHEYNGIFPVYHIDAYRISDSEDFEASCGSEVLHGQNVCLVEWSERIASCLPPNTIRVEIKISDSGAREIVVRGIADFQARN